MLTSGFANTDLDFQLRQKAISHVILAGMTANTCLDSTARYARERSVVHENDVTCLTETLILVVTMLYSCKCNERFLLRSLIIYM